MPLDGRGTRRSWSFRPVHFMYRQCIYNKAILLSAGGCMKAHVLKWGNSLAVRIPQVIAKGARLKEGDAVELTASEEGRVEVRRVSKIPTLTELVDRITPENRHNEISVGRSVGKESLE